jgi:phage shock protein PspC (stress-responsive transcriptional regulator)
VATWNERPGPGAGLVRRKRGRLVGGVCAGLARVSQLGVGWIRAAFVVAALLGGLGIALYLACWLIIPAEGDGSERPAATGAVVLAQVCAGCAGLAVLGALGAVATVFGFGWAVLGVAAAVLVGVVAGRPRLGPAWALLPVAALTVPALAVAASGLRLTTQTGASAVAPSSVAAIEHHVYRSGLNTMLVDLRRTPLPASGTVPLRIEGGLRRTIVALPSARCVHVIVHYDVNPFPVRLTALLTGRRNPIFSDAVVFGRLYARPSDTVIPPVTRPGPWLDITFSSQGGSLYVRDYPDHVDPDQRPDWPGYQVNLEPRPDIQGTPRKAAQRLIRNWRARLAAEQANARVIDSLMPGPCGAPTVATPPVPARHTARHTARRRAARPRRRSARPARPRTPQRRRRG